MIVIDFLKRFEVHSTLILSFLILLRQYADPVEEMPSLAGVDFEIFGRVQGVFFRKHTQKKAQELSLKGWCMNTKHNTVIGYVEGDKEKLEEMKHWLEKVGSPQSTINKAEFRNERTLSIPTQESFTIKK